MKVADPTEEQIRRRAHEIYVASGCTPGHDVDNWLQAEYDLRQLPVRKIAELEPPKTKPSRIKKPSLVAFVHSAVILGAGALSNLRR